MHLHSTTKYAYGTDVMVEGGRYTVTACVNLSWLTATPLAGYHLVLTVNGAEITLNAIEISPSDGAKDNDKDVAQNRVTDND